MDSKKWGDVTIACRLYHENSLISKPCNCSRLIRDTIGEQPGDFGYRDDSCFIVIRNSGFSEAIFKKLKFWLRSGFHSDVLKFRAKVLFYSCDLSKIAFVFSRAVV
jgi:hypothetical protein